jgi:hypothetical protein
MIWPRSYHTATPLGNNLFGNMCETIEPIETGNGKILVAGGSANGIPATFFAELYGPSTGTWAALATMITPRVYHTATPLGKYFYHSTFTNIEPCMELQGMERLLLLEALAIMDQKLRLSCSIQVVELGPLLAR